MAGGWKWLLGGLAIAAGTVGYQMYTQHELYERTLYRKVEKMVQSIRDTQLRAEADGHFREFARIEASGSNDPHWTTKAMPIIKTIRELKDKDETLRKQ